MKHDFYDRLGVSRGADEKEIKSAYRRLARKYHPDVNPGDKAAETRFKEISEAYEVLSDPEKKKLYDKFGSNWDQVSQGGGGGSEVNYDFGDMGGFGSFGSIFEQLFQQTGQPQRQRSAEPKDLEISVDVSLEEITTGSKRSLSYTTNDACKSCNGTGKVALRTSGFERCPTCGGLAVLKTNRKVEVKIPAGVASGQKLRVPGGGSRGANGRSGDLYIIVHEMPHARFERKGADLETEVEVPMGLAALGGEIKVATLGSQMTMKIPECTQNGQKFRLSGQGLPSTKGDKGSLFVKIKIAMPKHLSSEQKKAMELFMKAGGQS